MKSKEMNLQVTRTSKILATEIQICLQKLQKDEKNSEAFERLMGASHLIIKNSRYQKEWNLEWAVCRIIREFYGLSNLTGKRTQIQFFNTVFSRLLQTQNF